MGEKDSRSRNHYFGPIDDPDAALVRWLREKDYLLAGEEPPMETGGISVYELSLFFLNDVEARHDRGELNQSDRRHLIFAAKFTVKHLLQSRPLSTVGPVQFTKLREAVTATGRNLRSQKNLIIHVRSMFRWAARMGYCEAVDFGPAFNALAQDWRIPVGLFFYAAAAGAFSAS